MLDRLPLARALDRAETVRAEEVVLSVPDGRSVTTLINATPFRDPDDALFGLGFVVVAFPRSAAVCRKSCVSSSLPIRKVLVLSFAGGVSPPLWVVYRLFSASYPQTRRFYYLFFTTCMGRRFDRGKLFQITQGRGNKRFKVLWPLCGSRYRGDPIRRAKGADGPLRGRVWLATLFFDRCDGITIGRVIGDVTIGLRTKVPVK